MDLTDEECASNLKLLPCLAVIDNRVKEFVGNMVDFGAFWLAQANVVVFPPRRRVF